MSELNKSVKKSLMNFTEPQFENIDLEIEFTFVIKVREFYTDFHFVNKILFKDLHF